MTDDPIVYEYTPMDGYRLPGNVPEQDLTASRLERLTPEQRREVEAFAADGRFFHAVNKSVATRTMNRLQKDDVEAAEDAAKGGA